MDGSGNVYVADTWNHTIRKLTSGGVSSTLAGMAGTFGSFDGTNSGARFNCPTGVAVDGSGNIYVTDYNNDTIRKVTSAGVVTTLAGWAGMWGSADGEDKRQLFFGRPASAVTARATLYVVDSGNNTLRKITSGRQLGGQHGGGNRASAARATGWAPPRFSIFRPASASTARATFL